MKKRKKNEAVDAYGVYDQGKFNAPAKTPAGPPQVDQNPTQALYSGTGAAKLQQMARMMKGDGAQKLAAYMKSARPEQVDALAKGINSPYELEQAMAQFNTSGQGQFQTVPAPQRMPRFGEWFAWREQQEN